MYKKGRMKNKRHNKSDRNQDIQGQYKHHHLVYAQQSMN